MKTLTISIALALLCACYQQEPSHTSESRGAKAPPRLTAAAANWTATWDAPSTVATDPPSGYNLYEVVGTAYNKVNTAAIIPASPYVFSNATFARGTHNFIATAVYPDGSESDYSNTASVKKKGASPNNLSVQ